MALISNASKIILKILQARLHQYVNREIPDGHAGFRKGLGTRDQIASICWIIEKARQKTKAENICFIDDAKTFDCVDHNELWTILKEMGNSDYLTCLLRNLHADEEAIEPDMEQQTISKLGMEYVKPAHLSYMQSISCKMQGWIKYILESRLPGEISTTSDIQITPP